MERLSPRRIFVKEDRLIGFGSLKEGRCDAIVGKMIRPHVIGSEKSKKRFTGLMSRCAHRMEITEGRKKESRSGRNRRTAAEKIEPR